MGERAKVTTKTPEAKRENSASQTREAKFPQSIGSPFDQILFLQRTVGNHAVERLLKSGVVQAKLTIGQPGDIYEQEADRVAHQVMRMPDPSTAGRNGVSEYDQVPSIQRMCTECEEELHRQPMEEEEELLQTKEVSGSTPEVAPSVESQINSIGGGGQPLTESVRAFFEPRFGQDFSQVRIHTDSSAGESAKAVSALAYTVGHDVVFSGGQYSPETKSGKKLIAHELTHVVQQSGGALAIQCAPQKEKKKPAPEGKKEEQKAKAGGKKVVPSYPDCTPAPAKFEQLEAIKSNIFGHTALGAVSPLEADILFDNNICKTKVKSAPRFSLKEFIYAEEGDYPRGKESPTRPPCKGKPLDVYVHITPEVSGRIRDGEIEHCNDIHRAFDLTFARYLGVFKAFEGGFMALDAQSCQQAVSKIALDVTGIEPSKLPDTFLCLFNTSKSRDEAPNRWHTLAWGQPETAKYAKNCKSVIYTPDVKSALPEIGNHRSEDVVKGCGVK